MKGNEIYNALAKNIKRKMRMTYLPEVRGILSFIVRYVFFLMFLSLLRINICQMIVMDNERNQRQPACSQ